MALFNKTTTAGSTPAPARGHSPYDAIGDAEARAGGVYPKAGIYPCLYVDAIKMIRSRKGEDVFVAEFDILDSACAERPAGTRMSWACNFRHDASPGNVKAFLAAVMDVPADEVDADGAQYACGAENPCHGRLVRLEATDTTTKAGGPFTLCSWRALPQELQDQAAAARTEAGFR